MKVNKNSWHYKLLARTHVMSKFYADFTNIKDMLNRGMSLVQIYEAQYAWKDLPTNFCQYWRRAIIRPATTLAINSFVALILLALIASNPGQSLMILGAALGVFAMLAALLGFVFGSAQLVNWVTSNVSFADGLIGTAIKSHKENICTEVTYEDD